MSDTPLRSRTYVAERLGISVRTLYELVAAKRIAYVRIGQGRNLRAIRFRDEDIDAFIARNRQPSVPVEPDPDPPTSTTPVRRQRARVVDLEGGDRYVN
jgi:excisionase family DNA binding protein